MPFSRQWRVVRPVDQWLTLQAEDWPALGWFDPNLDTYVFRPSCVDENLLGVMMKFSTCILVQSLLFSLLPQSTHPQEFTSLSFPVAEDTPYTAPIVSVVDHLGVSFYSDDQNVKAYTGELGRDECGPSGSPCGFYNPHFSPQDDSDDSVFVVNGTYVGASLDCTELGLPVNCLERKKILNYRGHPGYDYSYTRIPVTEVRAPANGFVYLPASDPINGPRDRDPWCSRHTAYINHGGGLTTWYLHLDTLTSGDPHDCSSGLLDEDQAIHFVAEGQTFATVGDFDYNSTTGQGEPGRVAPHLHFELRACDILPNSGGRVDIDTCKIVDPYGWEWFKPDPIENTRFSGTTNPAAVTNRDPVWQGFERPIVTDVVLTPDVVLKLQEHDSLSSARTAGSRAVTDRVFPSGRRLTARLLSAPLRLPSVQKRGRTGDRRPHPAKYSTF